MDFELLISEVKKRSALWDPKNPNHSNRGFTEKCWTEVAEVMRLKVDIVKKKWKSLRDNFRVELRKVPIGKSDDPSLPIDQYLSKWVFFKMMFFLRDPMVEKMLSGNHTAASTAAVSAETVDNEPNVTSPVPSLQSLSETKNVLLWEETVPKKDATVYTALPKVANKRKRRRDQRDGEAEGLIAIQMEKVDIEKHKLQLLLQDNDRREREENDFDRHFVLSLLPMLKKIPERERTGVEIRLKQVLHEAVYGNFNEFATYRP
eukprot:gene9092-16747_t